MTQPALARALSEFVITQTITQRELDSPVPRYVLWRQAALGSDIRSAVEALLETYGDAQQAVQTIRKGATRISLDVCFERIDDPTRRFITAFKSAYIFIRAYQDAVCASLLELQGRPAGKYRSMKDCLKEGSATDCILGEALPEYAEWFRRWRADRDEIKLGARFSLHFDGEDSLSLAFVRPEGSGIAEGREIGLETIVEGLEMSARVTLTAFAQIDPRLLIRIASF